MDETRNTDTALVGVALTASERNGLIEVGELQVIGVGIAGPVNLGAIVRGKEDQGVVPLTGFIEGFDDLANTVVEVVNDGEEKAFFGVWLRLDDALGIIEPFDLVFIEPSLRVIGVELGGGVDKLTAFIEWGVRGVVSEVEKEGLIADRLH